MSGGEDGELGDRRGTGIPQPTKAQLDAAKRKRGEHVTGGPEGNDGFGGGPEGGVGGETSSGGSAGPGDGSDE